MIIRAPEAAAIEHWLDHTVKGHSMRQLAAAADLSPSTVMWRIRRIEGRSDDPAWSVALEALSAAVGKGVEVKGEYGILSALGTTASAVEEAARVIAMYERPNVIASGLPRAAIHDGQSSRSIARADVLALILADHLRFSRHVSGALCLTVARTLPAIREGSDYQTPAVARAERRPHPWDGSPHNRKCFSQAERETGRRLVDQEAISVADLESIIDGVDMAPLVSDALRAHFVRREGFEMIEDAFGLPARSAKVVIGIGLGEIARAGVI